jgi:ribonuclease P protein component
MRSPLGHPPHHRIRRQGDFDRAYKEGSRAKARFLLVVAVENGLDHSRLGLSVGKRIWRGAVQRNRVRRLFREAFRLSFPELPKGVDLVLIPAAPQIKPTLDEVRAELLMLSHKAHGRYLEKRRAAEGTPAEDAAASVGETASKGAAIEGADSTSETP